MNESRNLDVSQDGGANEVAFLVTGNDDVAAIQNAAGSLIDARLNETVDLLLCLWGNDWSDIRVGQMT